jgi:hypothetical protein
VKLQCPISNGTDNVVSSRSLSPFSLGAAVLILSFLALITSVEAELKLGAAMDAQESNKHRSSDCKDLFARLVQDLDRALASDPKSVDRITAAIGEDFPIKRCRIEEILPIARSSRFFVSSEEAPKIYNIMFSNANSSAGYGFFVLISLNKITGTIEVPFARVNNY